MNANDEQGAAVSCDLVVIGSSAGGIEALSVLVSTLPGNFPAPIVLAQHLDPNRPSKLAEILQSRTALAVEMVDTPKQLMPGTIYVVPANYHVLIEDQRVEVLGEHETRPKPSVDRLLSTAAASYGERLIAVILTGSGSDGAIGAVDVKAAGGTVIIQNPQTARYPSMPLSLPPTTIDFAIDIEQIGPLLSDLLSGAVLPATDKTEELLRGILERVSHQANIDFRPYKSATIMRRIARRMVVTHSLTLREYAQYLEANPQEVGDLVQALLINVTQFFRDPDSFAYLKEVVLPALLNQARSRDRVLRCWCAGCSSGEEPYSLAMLLTDLLGAELPEWNIKIFATDLDEAAITFARLGAYPENLLKDLPNHYRDRFFEHVGHTYRISKTLRQMVIFGHQDLSRSAPFPRMDLVLCRNVLIYFRPELQDYVLNQFAFSLRPNNGYLFLGKAEIIRPPHSYFELVNKPWKIYRCVGENVPVPRRLGLPELRARLDRSAEQQPGGAWEKNALDQDLLATTSDLALLRRLNELLLRFLPNGVVVIDRAYRVIMVNTAARRLLGLRDVGGERDFLHAVRGLPYTQVRAGIDTVFRERNPQTLPEILLDSLQGGSGQYLCLTIVPMPVDESTSELAVISVSDATEQLQNRQRLEAAQAEQAQLVNELSAANKRLNEMNKELLDANEEFQVANEEMMLTYEELQATNEEFEATNEELQATNEELETSNEELQATNEELQTTNEELRSRTSELQELTAALETERGRLAEMVALAPFYIMVLRGPQLIVEAFNPGYARLFEGREVHGRPLEQVTQYFWPDSAVLDLARVVYAEDAPRTSPRLLRRTPRHDDSSGGVSFVYTVVPTHDRAGAVDGVVIYAADVTGQHAQEVLEERERLRVIFEHADQVVFGLYDARTTELVMGTPYYLDVLRRAHPATDLNFIGRPWQETAFIGPPEEVARLWQQVGASGEPARLPEVHLKLVQDEHETIWNWSLIPIMDSGASDTLRFMLVLALEITEQVRARDEAERLDHLKDEFLSLASHELRTPLTSLIGNAYILERLLKQLAITDQVADKQRLVSYVESFKKQLERLNVLIEDLIDVSRLQSGKYTLKMEQVAIIEVVRQAVEEAQMARATPPIVLDAPDAAGLVVWGDRGRLMQVLLNLLQNALTYAPESPQLDVRARCVDDPSSGAAWVQIAVQDYGPGIGPEDQQAIFSRFYQTAHLQRSSHRGLGLGLFICKEIVEQHGGMITVNSLIGQGSTFIIRLPLHPG